jgi:hypothetical protein
MHFQCLADFSYTAMPISFINQYRISLLYILFLFNFLSYCVKWWKISSSYFITLVECRCTQKSFKPLLIAGNRQNILCIICRSPPLANLPDLGQINFTGWLLSVVQPVLFVAQPLNEPPGAEFPTTETKAKSSKWV